MGSLLVAGCNLYFGGDDDTKCQYGYGDDIAVQELRDPQTGECEQFGGGGGYCSPDCPCPDDVYNTPPVQAQPDWPSCYTQCDGLDEQGCLAAPGCHADYIGFMCPPNADCIWSGVTYWQCSAVAPSGPVEGGDCWGLDAQTCQEHDDCASGYQLPVDPGSTHDFNQCFPEPGTVDQCAAVDCGPGSHCEVQCIACDPKDPNTGCMDVCSATCVPDGDSCAAVDCAPGYTCEEICNGPICDPPGPCPDQCSAQCVPTGVDPGECYGQVLCNSAPPACPPSTTPGVANGCWTGYCIPTAACGKDPGTCDASGVMCDIAPPACPSGTEPGIANGCWTGYCIPDWACAQTEPCGAITDEKTCVSRADCTPIYDGVDCTCDPSGCTCASETFARCEGGIATPPPK